MLASSSKSAMRTARSLQCGGKAVAKPLATLTPPARHPAIVPSSLRTSRRLPIQRRSFFSLPDLSRLVGGDSSKTTGQAGDADGEEQRFHARKILPYTQAQLYTLVSDIPSYSSFIPFCTSSSVLSPQNSAESPSHRPQSKGKWPASTEEPFDVNAELKVGFGGFEEKYTSRVVGQPFDSVTATASSNSPLFRSLVSTWSFSPASPLSPHASAAPPPDPDHGHTRVPNDPAPGNPDDGPTLLTIDLAFTFANPLHRIASQAVLPMVADKMVEAFEKRCLEVYGKGTE